MTRSTTGIATPRTNGMTSMNKKRLILIIILSGIVGGLSAFMDREWLGPWFWRGLLVCAVIVVIVELWSQSGRKEE